MTERIWVKHPRFYQSPLWIRRVRLILELMSAAGVVLTVVAWQLFDIGQEGLVYIFCPLVFYIICLLSYRIVVFEVLKTTTKHWEETRINFPFAALVLMIPVLLIAHPTRSCKTVLGIYLLLLMYGYISMPYVNWVSCTGQPEYGPGIVVDKAH